MCWNHKSDSDSLGRLKSVTLPDSRLIEYALDWQGRRVQKSSAGSPQARSIFEDTYRLAADVNLQAPGIKEYVFATNVNSADYMKVGAVLYRIIKDHLGSPRLVVNASNGQVVQKMNYNEWGQVTLDTNPGFQAFGYAGGLYDPDTRLVKFGARDYDGRIGRWLSKDPIGFDAGDTNLYGYVLNDPVNFTDFSGLQIVLNEKFYKNRKLEGDAMADLMKYYLDYKKQQKNKKKNEKYNEPACRLQSKINAFELQNYLTNIRASGSR